MEPAGNIPMAPPPPLPVCAPPMNGGSSSSHFVLATPYTPNGHRSPVPGNGGGDNESAGDRHELMSEIREGVKLKATRDQILSSSRTPNGRTGCDSPVLGAASAAADDAVDDRLLLKKKTVHSELRHKLDEIDSAAGPVLPSQINPDGPGAPPPMYIPISTAIRVLQERERKESEMNQLRAASVTPTSPTTTPPSSRNGTLGRDGSLAGEKLMISHGKRNFTINAAATGTPKKMTIKNEKLVPKRNLLGGEGKMSSDLKKLLAADAENVVEPPQPPPPQPVNVQQQQTAAPQIKSPQLRSNPDAFRERHLNSPEAIEISNTLKRLISQDKVDMAPQLKANMALPEDHKISDQLKRLILEDLSKSESTASTTPSTISQSSSINSIPDVAVEKRTTTTTTPLGNGRPIARHPKSSPISPSVKNGCLIDNSIRIPLPPRVPSPPPPDNPRRLDSQLSCDRLNKEFQEFNAYRAANPPSPKKIAIPLDPNGAANYEKKTVVSFAQEMAAPNRYPDTVKVMKTVVQNGGGGGDTIPQLPMENIKFVIDPESSDSVVQVAM